MLEAVADALLGAQALEEGERGLGVKRGVAAYRVAGAQLEAPLQVGDPGLPARELCVEDVGDRTLLVQPRGARDPEQRERGAQGEVVAPPPAVRLALFVCG